MNAAQFAKALEAMEAAMPQLLADEKQAVEARLRQEGAIMVLRQLMMQEQRAETAPVQTPPAGGGNG